MLTIHRDLKAAMSKRRYDGFVERARRHFVRLWPLRCGDMGDAALLALIDEGVHRARKYGLTTERQAVCFLDMMFLLGRDFDIEDRPDGVLEILTRPYPGATKAKLLYAIADRVQRGLPIEVAP